MALFQNSVLKKYLKQQDSEAVAKAYKKFIKYFHDPKIQHNIRSSKEEEYQGIFLTELFSKILGYTMKPLDNFNLVAEYKNEKNSRKADGAILKDNEAIGVIELKGTNTKDLEKVRQQAFDYKANQTGCVYVITSNFEKIRFYINNAVEFEEFDLFTLNQERFELLYLCLAKDNLLSNIPLQIKESSVQEEEAITKQFYKDYSTFKRELFRDLVKQNMNNEVFRSELDTEDTERANKNIKQHLFKKSQKLIDRFLFVFFAEDRGLLPPNSTVQILEQWNRLKDDDAYFPLYHRYKLYFNYLDQGRAGTAKKAEIFAYNGGLFKPDAVLDSLVISDDLLYTYTNVLQSYDFESQVDVNILGHIFENSLNEIESVNAEIEGTDFDKQKTKRKKDGVFYTPKYITKYIVDNTVGKLCTEKKAELGIIAEEFHAKRQKETKKKLLANLEAYREWLLQLTICDPACGSGAFLNQALDFLIKEHSYIDELQTNLLGGGFVFPNIENTVLENNIFGVDLNEESVEIAKLSLWLRTAQPRRKLNSLNNNIKCGNSLISDPKVAGDKAFNWQEEFPKVFKEKDKKLYHITTTIHDSRTSKRMIDYKVREKRDMGTNPYPNIVYFTPEDDLLITKTIAEVVTEQNINLLAYNICADHIHLLIACDIDEVPTIMKNIKGKTSYYKGLSFYKGFKPLEKGTNKEENKKPLWQQKYSAPKEVTSQEQLQNTLNYIQKNRSKHNLPEHSTQLKNIIQNMCCSFDTAIKLEYTGGFDVVIGNPPYVRKQGLVEHYPEMCTYYESKFMSATANYDIYALFMEESYKLINNKGIVSFILPHKFLVSDFGAGMRGFFKENTAVENLVHFGSEIVFKEASTYTCIVDLTKSKKEKVKFKKVNPSNLADGFIWDTMSYSNLSSSNWDLQSESVFEVIEKLKQQPFKVDDVFDKIFQGIATSLDAVYVFKGEDKGSYIKGYNEKFDYHFQIEKEMVSPVFGGRDIFKYQTPEINNYVIFPYHLNNHEAKPMEEDYISKNLPKAYGYLKHFEKEIKGRERGRMNIEKGWFLYIYPKNLPYFQKPKIMTREISLGCNMTYDEKGEYYHNTKVYSFIKNKQFDVDEKFYLGILNSRIMWFFLKNTGSEYGGGYYVFKTNYLKPFPLPEISGNSNVMIENVNLLLSSNKDLQEVSSKFQRSLQRKFESLEKLPRKLENWYELTFADFVKELKKKKIKLSLGEEEGEWEDYFLAEKQKAVTIKSQIDKTDAEIDRMVYKLYNLTEEEIQIVEQS